MEKAFLIISFFHQLNQFNRIKTRFRKQTIMKKILQYLFEYKTLGQSHAKEIIINIGKGIYNETEIASFITVFLMRSITIEELQGFRDGLLELCVSVDLNGYKTIDIVGTGGDGKNTFNIST